MDNYCYLTITPISRDTKSAGNIDYNEQLSRVLHPRTFKTAQNTTTFILFIT